MHQYMIILITGENSPSNDSPQSVIVNKVKISVLEPNPEVTNSLWFFNHPRVRIPLFIVVFGLFIGYIIGIITGQPGLQEEGIYLADIGYLASCFSFIWWFILLFIIRRINISCDFCDHNFYFHYPHEHTTCPRCKLEHIVTFTSTSE